MLAPVTRPTYKVILNGDVVLSNDLTLQRTDLWFLEKETRHIFEIVPAVYNDVLTKLPWIDRMASGLIA